MTDLRTAAQQALEAMSSFESGTNGLYEGEFAEEISALRAALVEDAMQKFTDVNQELEAALAEPVQKNDWLPPHKCGLQLIHNEHKDVYEELEDHYHPDDFVSPEEWDKAVRENSVWTLQWYPETPVGFHRITASSLEAIQQALKENKYD